MISIVRLLLALTVILAGWSIRLWAQSPTLVSIPELEINAVQWIVFISNVGFGGVFLYYLLVSLRRQHKLEDLVRRYDEVQHAHLQDFRDLSDLYRALVERVQDTVRMDVAIQTKLVEKLERMERLQESR